MIRSCLFGSRQPWPPQRLWQCALMRRLCGSAASSNGWKPLRALFRDGCAQQSLFRCSRAGVLSMGGCTCVCACVFPSPQFGSRACGCARVVSCGFLINLSSAQHDCGCQRVVAGARFALWLCWLRAACAWCGRGYSRLTSSAAARIANLKRLACGGTGSCQQSGSQTCCAHS